MSTTRERKCQECGNDKAKDENKKLMVCGACKSVRYCCKEHQISDWKVHKKACKIIRAKLAAKEKKTESNKSNSGTVIVVEVKSREGNGLCNVYINHIFPSKLSALDYIAKKFNTSKQALKPLTQMGFLRGVMKFRSAELYINPNQHDISIGNPFMIADGGFPSGIRKPGHENCLNGLAIYLGCRLDNGISAFNNIKGTVFFIGKTKENMYVTSNILWGAANLICDAMDYFGDEDADTLQHTLFKEWGKSYVQKTWQPKGGSEHDGLVYETDVTCDRSHKLIDHCGS